MKIFIVIQQGIHFKGIAGVFDNLCMAKIAAQEFANSDDDDWHTWDIVSCDLNKKHKMENNGCQIEQLSVLYTRKKGVKVTP